ncbi:MAG: oxidoreductase [Pseudomonadota bacterium]
MTDLSPLFQPLTLPCGTVLKNRIAKSAMSDSMGDGRGNPGPGHARLYERWADGGTALSFIGEVQGDASAAEKPGNLVLGPHTDRLAIADLTQRARRGGALIFAQLGHAGAMAHPPISRPRGPSALALPGLTCDALSAEEIATLPAQFAATAKMAQGLGFSGVQIHAAHGFLLSQFLSPLFNHRTDDHGGRIQNRMRLLLGVIQAVRAATGLAFPIALKLNATDQLAGGLSEGEALQVAEALDDTTIDLLDISGGTYFPGAPSASDRTTQGAYFAGFAQSARRVFRKPIMLTGGVKTARQALDIITDGTADVVGLARALVLYPDLPNQWRAGAALTPQFPRFQAPPEGGITAWYTMRLTDIGLDQRPSFPNLPDAVAAYDARDAARTRLWRDAFGAQ